MSRGRTQRELAGFIAGPWLLAGLLLAAYPARAGELTVEGAVEQASGEYGQDQTTGTWSLATDFSYRRGRWSLLLSVPVFRQDSSLLLHSGGVRVPAGHPPEHAPGHGQPGHGGGSGQGGGGGHGGGGGGGHQDPPVTGEDNTGFGDPILRADVVLSPYLPWGLALGFFAAVKPPVAGADSGFSTGEWDAGAGFVAWRDAFRTAASLEVGYWRLGDPPALELEDSFTFSLAVARVFPDRRLSVGGLVRGYSSTLSGNASAVEVGFTLSRTLRASRAIGLTLSAGLTEAAPDFRVTAGWRLGRLAGWRVGRP